MLLCVTGTSTSALGTQHGATAFPSHSPLREENEDQAKKLCVLFHEMVDKWWVTDDSSCLGIEWGFVVVVFRILHWCLLENSDHLTWSILHIYAMWKIQVILPGQYFISMPCGKFRLSYLGKSTAAARWALPIPASVRSMFMWYGCQCLGFLTCTQMLMHVTTNGGYVNTVRESALKVDWGRKNPCDIRELNLYQYCAMLFGLTLYQLSCPAPVHCYWFEPW